MSNFYEKRAEKLRAEQRAQHNEWKQQQEAEQQAATRENDAARQRYLNKLAAEKRAKQLETDEKTEAELQPQKAVLMRQWLADHPGKTEAEFNREAWQHLKANLLAEREQQVLETTQRDLAATGLYSL